MNEKKPLKARNLKIIDHKGTLFATFDGSKFWKLEKHISKLLIECDGKKTFDEISQKIASASGFKVEDIKIGLKPIFDEFERNGLITYV